MKPYIDTFREMHIPEPMSGCWLWTGAINNKGYGTLSRQVNKKTQLTYAHRFSWEHHTGPIPEGMCVCHKCDVPCCVNPDHLFLGTRQDNSDDMVAKGRSNRGEGRWKAKLNEGKVRDIRSSNKPQTVLAKELGVTVGTIYKALHRETWAHVK